MGANTAESLPHNQVQTPEAMVCHIDRTLITSISNGSRLQQRTSDSGKHQHYRLDLNCTWRRSLCLQLQCQACVISQPRLRRKHIIRLNPCKDYSSLAGLNPNNAALCACHKETQTTCSVAITPPPAADRVFISRCRLRCSSCWSAASSCHTRTARQHSL